MSRRRAQATRGSGLSCLMGGLNAPTRSPSRRSRGELRSRGYAPTSSLPTKPPASPFPRARKGRTWLVRHFRVPSQALGRRCPPIVDRAVRSRAPQPADDGRSPTGGPAVILSMLEFCARHKIEPLVEEYPLSKVNEALEHLNAGKARYRLVLRNDLT